MLNDLFGLAALATVVVVWVWAAAYYERIYHCTLKPWAYPFALGLLLFAKRAPREWEE